MRNKTSETVTDTNAQKLKQQDMVRKQKEQASKNYMQNVYNSLKDGKVGSIKGDKKTQSFIFL